MKTTYEILVHMTNDRYIADKICEIDRWNKYSEVLKDLKNRTEYIKNALDHIIINFEHEKIKNKKWNHSLVYNYTTDEQQFCTIIDKPSIIYWYIYDCTFGKIFKFTKRELKNYEAFMIKLNNKDNVEYIVEN